MDDDDIENFIEEVQKRPALYDKNLQDYSNLKLKHNLWEEICSIVIKDWDVLSPELRFKTVLDVQKKWQNLRNCFARELRIQKNTKPFIKRRKYMYFDKLMFLLDHTEKRDYKRSIFDNTESEESENEEDEDDTHYYKHKQAKPNTSFDEESTTFEQSKVEVGQNHQNDSTQFALSLVPMLSSLTDYQKIEAKIQILSILKAIKWGPTEPGKGPRTA